MNCSKSYYIQNVSADCVSLDKHKKSNKTKLARVRKYGTSQGL